jgi:hypothetical protein
MNASDRPFFGMCPSKATNREDVRMYKYSEETPIELLQEGDYQKYVE